MHLDPFTTRQADHAARAVLFVAHPGHELRVHHWLERYRPLVCVLTDGSGSTGVSRLASTSAVLAAAGATPGPIYGRFTDRELYAAIRQGSAEPFLKLAQTLADTLITAGAELVVGDALEGFNPGHDMCRYLMNIAVALVERKTGRRLENRTFVLDAAPGSHDGQPPDRVWTIELDEAAFERKLAAASGYPEMRQEVDSAIGRFGRNAFAVECLMEAGDLRQGVERLAEEPPGYERYGEMRVSSGLYQDVVRYRRHVQPLVRTLWHAALGQPAPMPIIIGAPRSGTTLLRLMLDAHPSLAIPPETGFLAASSLYDCDVTTREGFYRVVTTFPPDAPAWADFGLDAGEFRSALASIDPFDPAEGFRLFYRQYATRQGKPRYGDKTPTYAQHLPAIERLLPEAHFIHLVRDGRDVALSLREAWFAPAHDIAGLARYWRTLVEAARSAGRQARHYLEVSYEALVDDPEPVLANICRFIDLPPDRSMLEYWQRAPERLREHRTRLCADGRVLVTHEQRLHQQHHTTHPPKRDRIFAWKRAMTAEEREEFLAVAAPTLSDLGYET